MDAPGVGFGFLLQNVIVLSLRRDRTRVPLLRIVSGRE